MSKVSNPTANNTDPEGSGWSFISDLCYVCVESLFFAFTIYMLFARIRGFVEQSSDIPDFFQRVHTDMSNSSLMWTGFFVIFIIWLVFRLIRLTQEREDKREMHTLLRKIQTSTEKDQTLMQKVIEVIDKTNNERNERDERLIKTLGEQTEAIIAALEELEPKGRDEEY